VAASRDVFAMRVRMRNAAGRVAADWMYGRVKRRNRRLFISSLNLIFALASTLSVPDTMVSKTPDMLPNKRFIAKRTRTGLASA